MLAARTPAQQSASRANGARSRGPIADAGEDAREFERLRAAVAAADRKSPRPGRA